MSETANTLIKAALRAIGAIASGETPTSNEMAEGLEALKIMLREWSGNNMLVYYQEQDTVTMTGASSYTIGSGGDCSTVRPVEIKGAVVDDIYELKIIDEQYYRKLNLSSLSAQPAFLWYNPEYPLGILYPYPTGGSQMVIDSLKPLTEPSAITDSIQFPTSYDSAIKWNLAIELAPEYGVEPSQIIYRRAMESKRLIESKNFASQVNAAILDLIKPSGGNFDINYR